VQRVERQRRRDEGPGRRHGVIGLLERSQQRPSCEPKHPGVVAISTAARGALFG